jgi:hypothetical protein
LQGDFCKPAGPHPLPLDGPNRGNQRGGGAFGGHGRRRSGHEGPRLRHGTGRGDRDEHDGGLTSGGGIRQRPVFEGQRRRSLLFPAVYASSSRAAALQGGGGGQLQEGGSLGRERAAQLGRLGLLNMGARGGQPGQGRRRCPGHGRHLASGWVGPAGPGGWAGVGGPSRCGSSPRARPKPQG